MKYLVGFLIAVFIGIGAGLLMGILTNSVFLVFVTAVAVSFVMGYKFIR